MRVYVNICMLIWHVFAHLSLPEFEYAQVSERVCHHSYVCEELDTCVISMHLSDIL